MRGREHASDAQSLAARPLEQPWGGPEAHAPGLAKLGITRESTIAVRVVVALVEAVERMGIPRGQLVRAAGLEPAQLVDPDARLPRVDVYRLCERALDLTGDPALGLHCGERLSGAIFGPLSNLVAHAATLREGLASLARFFRLISDEASYAIVERESEVTVRSLQLTGASPRVQRFAAELMTVRFLQHLRCFGADAQPERVCFAFPAPSYRDEYTRIFGGAVRFEQPFSGMVFGRGLLSRPALDKDEDLHETMKAVAERRLMLLTQRTPYALRVRELLVRQGLPLCTEMSGVAQALGLSVRSLRRRLAEEGKPYGEVVHEALAIIAKQLLEDRRRTIQAVGFEMGFSNPSTFHRAFKRWTGTTPGGYRDAQRRRAGA